MNFDDNQSDELQLGLELTLSDTFDHDRLLDTSRSLAYNLREKIINGAFYYEVSTIEARGVESPVNVRISGRGLVGGPLLRWDYMKF